MIADVESRGARWQLPPGPKAESIPQVLSWARRPVEFIRLCAARYGDAFTIRLAAEPPIVLFSHPEAVRAILTGDDDGLRAGEANLALASVLGQRSLLLLDGVGHRRARRLMMPLLHGRRVHEYGEIVRTVAARAVDGWPRGRTFSLHAEMRAVTLDAILRIVFGDGGGNAAGLVRSRIAELLARAAQPLIRVPGVRTTGEALKPALARSREDVDRLLVREIARRRAETRNGGAGVLGMLLEMRDDRGRPLTDAELCDELVTLLVAGHETTATSLAWLFHAVLGLPEVQQRLGADIRGARGRGQMSTGPPAGLRYVDATIKETLRLNPVFLMVGRVLHRPMRIGGYDLPPGIVVGPCVYLTHRRPDLWVEPERFEPERFLRSDPSPYEYLPFGGGSRRCLGMTFATYEMAIVVAEVVSRAVLRPASGERCAVTRRNITLAPADGVPVVLEARLDEANGAHG